MFFYIALPETMGKDAFKWNRADSSLSIFKALENLSHANTSHVSSEMTYLKLYTLNYFIASVEEYCSEK